MGFHESSSLSIHAKASGSFLSNLSWFSSSTYWALLHSSSHNYNSPNSSNKPLPHGGSALPVQPLLIIHWSVRSSGLGFPPGLPRIIASYPYSANPLAPSLRGLIYRKYVFFKRWCREIQRSHNLGWVPPFILLELVKWRQYSLGSLIKFLPLGCMFQLRRGRRERWPVLTLITVLTPIFTRFSGSFLSYQLWTF